jgi:hypothetical protein
MPALEKVANRVARPLKVLVPLIQAELDAGTRAGLEHYRAAGLLLIEAKDQQPYGSWERWVPKNLRDAEGQPLSARTASRYMRLAKMDPAALRPPGGGSDYTALLEGARVRGLQAHRSWRPVLKAARELDAELYAQERQRQDDEVRLHRELAAELIDLGYRALATRLHPDRGGSKDAMRRLNTVREQLKSVAETRRFV